MQPLGSNDPTRIGGYRLLGVLGAGGMGKVYLGRNAGGRTVAVKVIRPDLLGAPASRARFRREVAAAQRVGGEFTAPVLDADVDADPPWLATGYVAGLSLADAVTRFGPFAQTSLVALGRGLAQALVAVHGVGIVHRDLKPSNVLLAVDGPKLIDFGIARAVEDTALTTTGAVIGSPGFMCPEQVTGEPLGPACDVFALGGVLIFAASGQGPFGTAELVQLLWRIVYEQPRLDALPAALRPLVESCVAKEPAARPTPRQVLAELAALGPPGDTDWLPPPVLRELSTRAVRLLDLDADPRSGTDVPDRAQVRTVTGISSGFGAGRDRSAHNPADPTPPGDRVGSFAATVRRDAQVPAGHPAAAPSSSGRARRTRALLIAAAATVAVTVAGGAYLIGTRLGAESDAAHRSSSVAPSGSATVPAQFVGTWRGRAVDGLVQFDIVVTIGAGSVGEELATSSNTGTVAGERCERAETLTEAFPDRLVFRARLTGNSSDGCVDEGAVSTVTWQPDGVLRYSTPGLLTGTITGFLRKS